MLKIYDIIDVSYYFSLFRNVVFLGVFILYTTNFFNGCLIYKLITCYIFVNVAIRFFEFFTLKQLYSFAHNSFLITQLFIISLIYYLLLHKKTYVLCIGIFNLLLLLFVALKFDFKSFVPFTAFLTYLFIIIFSNIYYFTRINKVKRYYYFNTGIYFFVLVSIVLFSTSYSLFFITENEIFIKFFFPITLMILEISFYYLLIREWKFVCKK